MTIIYDFGNIADWVSAIGTLAAVGTSLYLANRNNKKIANIMTVHHFGENEWGVKDREKDLLQINIINSGNKTIHLMKISGKLLRIFRKSINLVTIEKENQIDYSLKPGEKFSKSVDIVGTGEALYLLGFIRKKKMRIIIFFEDIEGKKYKKRLTIDFSEKSHI